MKMTRRFIRLAFVMLLLPFADPKAFFQFFLLSLVFLVVICVPLIAFGFMVGLGIQLGNYVVYLWNNSGNDTKLTVVVGSLVAIIPTIVALPVTFDIFLNRACKTENDTARRPPPAAPQQFSRAVRIFA